MRKEFNIICNKQIIDKKEFEANNNIIYKEICKEFNVKERYCANSVILENGNEISWQPTNYRNW